MRDTQEHDPASDVEPAPGQTYCGRIEAVVPDDAAGTIWLVTASHAITVEWPTDARAKELPQKGEPAFYAKDLDVVAFGGQGAQRFFSVARMSWGLEGDRGAESKLSVLALSVVSIAMLVLSFALLGNAYFHIVLSPSLESHLATVSVAVGAVAALLQWKLVVPHWTSRAMVGIAPRPDLQSES